MSCNDFKYAQNIYDIMAIAYCQVKDKFNPEFRELYVPDDFQEILDSFTLYWEAVKNDANALNILITKLTELISDIESIKDKQCYAILEAIDKIPYAYKTSKFGSMEKIKKLNITNDNIYIYPRPNNSIIQIYNDSFKKYDEENGVEKESNRGLREIKDYGYSVRQEIKNYEILESYELHNYIPVLYSYNDNGTLFQNFMERGALKIALIPFIDSELQELFTVRESEKSFWIEGVKPESRELIIQQYKSILNKVLNEDLDIIVFPEMFLIEEVIPYIEEELSECHNYKPQIVFSGTLWKNDENKCVVFDKTRGFLFEQHKQKPFCYMRKKQERLSFDNKEINILDIYGLGRIFTFICKDIDDDELLELPKKMHADIIILPSYTESMDLQSNPEVLASRFHCITIMSNSCSAIKEKNQDKTIGFSCYPAKIGSRRVSKILNYCRDCDSCKKPCCYQILTITPSKIVSEENVLCCEANLH